MLIDHAKIYIAGGLGGDGCQSLYKDKYHRRGIPDGGAGGAGGDLVIESDSNLHTLLDFRYNQHHNADKGKNGSSNNKIGRRGADCILKVPVGTIIVDAANGLVIRDLSSPEEKVIAAKGGAAGKGNGGTRKEATKGSPGETKTILLDLKLVADAGIIGFPNAGKSTLVSRISKSHTKIAPYPFTTKSPRLGVVKVFDNSFVAADMPGIIEGAHEGRGLGDRFLRHIERTFTLVHVVDIMPLDGTDPADNFFKLEKELKLYDNNVYNKPRVVVVNKMDMTGAKKALSVFEKAVEKKVFAISSVTGEGIRELIQNIYKVINDARKKNEENND